MSDDRISPPVSGNASDNPARTSKEGPKKASPADVAAMVRKRLGRTSTPASPAADDERS
jgi:hypothetical protein